VLDHLPRLQTKDTLTLRASSFGSKCELPAAFIEKVGKSGVCDSILAFANFKQNRELKKTDGAKRSRLLGAWLAVRGATRALDGLRPTLPRRPQASRSWTTQTTPAAATRSAAHSSSRRVTLRRRSRSAASPSSAGTRTACSRCAASC